MSRLDREGRKQTSIENWKLQTTAVLLKHFNPLSEYIILIELFHSNVNHYISLNNYKHWNNEARVRYYNAVPC